jgi:hypothetical protein
MRQLVIDERANCDCHRAAHRHGDADGSSSRHVYRDPGGGTHGDGDRAAHRH